MSLQTRAIHGACVAVVVTAMSVYAAAADAAPAPDAIWHYTSQEAANMQVVLRWSRLLFSGHPGEAFQRYVSKRFVEHSHLVTSRLKDGQAGYAQALAFLTQDLGAAPAEASDSESTDTPAPPQKALPTLVADGDMVTLYSRIGADIFRVQNGKITDHWDATPQRRVVLPGQSQ